MFIQENNHRVQEKIQQEAFSSKSANVKHITDMVPEILYDPRKDINLMIRISEPNSKNMKGGFRHDPYQSGNLQTPIHKRAYLGAHAKAPIIYIDELKTLIKEGYMSGLLEIMQLLSNLRIDGQQFLDAAAGFRVEFAVEIGYQLLFQRAFGVDGFLRHVFG